MSRELSRRDFIAAAGVTGTALSLGAGLTGCSTSGTSANSATNATTYDISKKTEADVVVVGAGGAGCSAAVRAAQLGLDVALVEITNVIGGTTICTEGMTTIHSHFHKADPSIDIATNLLVHKIMDYHHWLPNGHIIQQMLVQSSNNLDWLESMGHEFTAPSTMSGNTYHTWTMYAHPQGTLSGSQYIQHWSDLCTTTYADKITMYWQTEALGTTLDADGKVASVICKDTSSDEYTEITTSSVVYATGGYADNGTLFKELVGFGDGEYQSDGMGHRTGDGLNMGRDNGAKLCRYPGAAMWYGGCLPGLVYGGELYCATAFQPLFWVNENAERFIDEEYAEHNFSFSGNGQSAQKRVVSILTKAQMDSFVTDGCIYGCGAYILDGTKLDGSATGSSMWSEYQAQVKAGNKYMWTADSIAELAGLAGLDAATLKETVDTYNGYCASGTDGDFDKPAIYLRPLNDADGPYYAFELVPGVFTTVGGLLVNDCIQVLNEDDDPIVGMYATGCDAGGLEGDSYDVGICEGSKQCWCAYSGKLAAEHIASTLFGNTKKDAYSNPVTWE